MMRMVLFWNKVLCFPGGYSLHITRYSKRENVAKYRNRVHEVLLCSCVDFLIKSLAYLYTSLFLLQYLLRERVETNTLTIEITENIYQNIKIAFEERVLNVTFSVKIFGFHCFRTCFNVDLNKNSVKQILCLNIFYFHKK